MRIGGSSFVSQTRRLPGYGKNVYIMGEAPDDPMCMNFWTTLSAIDGMVYTRGSPPVVKTP